MLIRIWCLASVIFRPCEVLRSSVDAIASWAARRHTALLCLECHKIRVPAHGHFPIPSPSHSSTALPVLYTLSYQIKGKNGRKNKGLLWTSTQNKTHRFNRECIEWTYTMREYGFTWQCTVLTRAARVCWVCQNSLPYFGWGLDQAVQLWPQ